MGCTCLPVRVRAVCLVLSLSVDEQSTYRHAPEICFYTGLALASVFTATTHKEGADINQTKTQQPQLKRYVDTSACQCKGPS